METFHGFEPPGLSFHPFGLCPADRFPVGGQHQAGACIGQFNAISAWFPDIKEKSLLNGMFMGAGFNENPVFKADIGRPQYILAAIHRIGGGTARRSRLHLW